jgi:hypothetical protein
MKLEKENVVKIVTTGFEAQKLIEAGFNPIGNDNPSSEKLDDEDTKTEDVTGDGTADAPKNKAGIKK